MPDAAAPSAPASGAAPADAQAPAEGAAPEAKTTAPPSEKFTVKVNGKLRELSREDAIRELQKGFASRENFEKSAALTRKNQTILKALADPDEARQEEALRQLGVDPDKIAERRLAYRAQQAQMTPEERQYAEREAEIARREQAIKEQESKFQSERAQALEQQTWAQMEAEYTTEIERAIKSGELSGMRPAEVLFHMANEAELNLEYGLQLSPAELLAEAKAKVAEGRVQFNQRAKALEGEALLAEIEPDVLNKILKAAVSRFKGGQPIQQLERPAPIGQQQQEPEPKKWVRGDMRAPFL